MRSSNFIAKSFFNSADVIESFLIQLHEGVWLDDDIVIRYPNLHIERISCSLSLLIQKKLKDMTYVGITTHPHREIWTCIKQRRPILRVSSVKYSDCRAVMTNQEALNDQYHPRHARTLDVGLSREDMFRWFSAGADTISHMAEHEGLAVTPRILDPQYRTYDLAIPSHIGFDDYTNHCQPQSSGLHQVKLSDPNNGEKEPKMI